MAAFTAEVLFGADTERVGTQRPLPLRRWLRGAPSPFRLGSVLASLTGSVTYYRQ